MHCLFPHDVIGEPVSRRKTIMIDPFLTLKGVMLKTKEVHGILTFTVMICDSTFPFFYFCD